MSQKRGVENSGGCRQRKRRAAAVAEATAAAHPENAQPEGELGPYVVTISGCGGFNMTVIFLLIYCSPISKMTIG